MRKHLAVFSIILCLSIFFAFPVCATGPDVDVYVTPKGTLIDVSIETSSEVGALQGAISYDGDAIEYDTAAANSNILSYNAAGNSFMNSNGITRVALVGDPSSGTVNKWASVTYYAEENTPAEFTLNGFKAFAVDGSDAGASFSVVVLGDANGDKLVNVKDYVKLKLVIAQSAGYTVNPKNLNVNKMGGTDGYDMTALRNIMDF
ncbi:MAG: hypothetical protein IKZ47_07460 [Clostridia bacterium]|nr:hypothetical protein [Clostridia bacterium]